MQNSYPTTVSTYILNEDGTRTYLTKDEVVYDNQPVTVSNTETQYQTTYETKPVETQVQEQIVQVQQVNENPEVVQNTEVYVQNEAQPIQTYTTEQYVQKVENNPPVTIQTQNGQIVQQNSSSYVNYQYNQESKQQTQVTYNNTYPTTT